MVYDDHAVLRQPDVELQSVRAQRQTVIERRERVLWSEGCSASMRVDERSSGLCGRHEGDSSLRRQPLCERRHTGVQEIRSSRGKPNPLTSWTLISLATTPGSARRACRSRQLEPGAL